MSKVTPEPAADIMDHMPGHLARRFQQIAVALFHAECSAAGYDLTPVQYAALVAIRKEPGLDQATLSGRIAFDRTTITGVIDRLAQKALIERRPSKTDRRAHALAITDAGEALLQAVQPAVDAAQRQMLQGLNPGEAENFMRLFQKVIRAANGLSRAPLR
jgi:MarR family transcriptional regulator, temperature-dependent positive regulator of motility